MNHIKSYIFILVTLCFLIIPITNVFGQDFSTPLAAITTLETELFKGNFDLYKNSVYYSPELIAQIPAQFGMSYEYFCACLNKALVNNLSLIKRKLDINNPQVERIEVAKELKIDEAHTQLFYEIYYYNKIEPLKDNSYFIKIEDGWKLDMEPEIKNIIQQGSASKLCTIEFKKAVDLDKKLGLNTLRIIDSQRATFDYDGYRVSVGLWNKDMDYFDIGQVGGNENKIAYQFYIKNPMLIRDLNDVSVLPEFKKRLDYVTKVARLIDEKALGKYNNVGELLSIEVDDINLNILTFKSERQYEPGEERLSENPVYKNIKPIEVSINLDDWTVSEKSLIAQEKQSNEELKHIKKTLSFYYVLSGIKDNFLKLMILFLALLVTCFFSMLLLARLFKVFPPKEIAVFLISFIISTMTTILVALSTAKIFVALFSEQMVASFGLIVGLVYGFLLFRFIGLLIIIIISFFLIKFLLKTDWLRALILSFLMGCLLFLFILFIIPKFLYIF